MCECGRRRRRSGEAFVTSAAFPSAAATATWSQAGSVHARAGSDPDQGHGNLGAPCIHYNTRQPRRKDRSPSLSLHLLPISFRTEEDGRCAVPLRSLSAPAHSGGIVRARGVGRVALHCKQQGDAVAGFLTDSAHCSPCSSPSLGREANRGQRGGLMNRFYSSGQSACVHSTACL